MRRYLTKSSETTLLWLTPSSLMGCTKVKAKMSSERTPRSAAHTWRPLRGHERGSLHAPTKNRGANHENVVSDDFPSLK